MAFIEKAGEILKKSLTQTLEDPEKLKRGLELFARGVTLPDADDSTGDLSESAFALGRFRQEARKRDQEDIAAANKAQQEAEARQKLAELEFKKGELDRKITADVELARIGEREDERRFKARNIQLALNEAAAQRRYREGQANAERRLRERMSLDKLKDARSRKKAAKEDFYKWLTKGEAPFEFYGKKLKDGSLALNRMGIELLTEADLKLKPSEVQKLIKNAYEAKNLYIINEQNKVLKPDQEGMTDWGDATISALNNALPSNQRVSTSKASKFFPDTKLDGKPENRVNATQSRAEGASSDYLSSISILVPRVFLATPTEERANILGMRYGDLITANQRYSDVIASALTGGLKQTNKPLDDFIKSNVIPLLRRTKGVAMFEAAFNRATQPVQIEGDGSVVPGQANVTRRDFSFLSSSPIVARTALALGILKPDQFQNILASMENDKQQTAEFELTPITPDPTAVRQDSSRERNVTPKTTVKLKAMNNFYPSDAINFLANMDNIFSAIGDETSPQQKADIESILEGVRKDYHKMTPRQRQNVYGTFMDILNNNKSIYLNSDQTVNEYDAFVMAELLGNAVSKVVYKGGQEVTYDLSKDTQVNRYIKDNNGNQQLSKIFERRGRVQSQRQDMDTKLRGIQALLEMSDDQANNFLGQGSIEDQRRQAESANESAIAGRAGEIFLFFDNLIKTSKSLITGASSEVLPPQLSRKMSTLTTNTYADLKNNSMYMKSSEQGFSEQFGYNVNMNGDNRQKMSKLDATVRDQYQMLRTDFLRDSEQNKTEGEKKKALATYLKRTTMLWEKTALTYQLAGYVQGDQTGGRTISNQDFDNIYRALWGGQFFTEEGAKNAIRYLMYKNNEALARGTAEDILLQATGRTFAESQRNIEAVRYVNKRRAARYFEKNPNVKAYLDSTRDGNNSSDAATAKKDSNRIFMSILSIPSENRNDTVLKIRNAFAEGGMEQLSKNVLQAGRLQNALHNYRVEVDSSGLQLNEINTSSALSAYNVIYDSLKANNNFGQFLIANSLYVTGEDKNGNPLMPNEYPSALQELSKFTIAVKDAMDADIEGLEDRNSLNFNYLEILRRKQQEQRQQSNRTQQ